MSQMMLSNDSPDCYEPAVGLFSHRPPFSLKIMAASRAAWKWTTWLDPKPDANFGNYKCHQNIKKQWEKAASARVGFTKDIMPPSEEMYHDILNQEQARNVEQSERMHKMIEATGLAQRYNDDGEPVNGCSIS
jgi:hypothetical protein